MYSQNDEEQVILANVPATGRFLDIGAYNGRSFSNTLALAERGWSGVCVEPSAAPFASLVGLHKDRPDIQMVNALVGPAPGLTKFWGSPDAVSTSDPNHYAKWQKTGQFSPTWVAAITVGDLLRQFPGPYDFVNIDCEGKATKEIFDGLALVGFAGARLVCVEIESAEEMIGTAARVGFQLIHRTSENLLFRRA